MYCIPDFDPGTKIGKKDYDSAPRAELVAGAAGPLSCLKQRVEKWFR